jgi:integrase
MPRRPTGQVLERERDGGRVFALRFRAYGKRRYVTLGATSEGWTRQKAEEELANVLADVRRGIWQPQKSGDASEPPEEPTFHEFASEWFETRRHEFAPRTREDYELTLTRHLLPFFKDHLLSEITAQETDRYKAAKVREREEKLVERPLSNTTINKTLTRLGQILDAAMRYDLIPFNPVKGRVEKLKQAEPTRTRLSGHQVQALFKVAGKHRALVATAVMASGLRVSELTHLQWKNLDLKARVLWVPVSKTAAGQREIALEPELVQLLREHKVSAKWSEPDDFIFSGRSRKKARDRNSVRTKILYPAIERANEQLAAEDRPPFPEKVTFHSLRRTYAAIRAELGEHAAVTAAQMGHRDPRMTLRVYTDVTGVKPRTRMGGLLGDEEWAPFGHQDGGDGGDRDQTAAGDEPKSGPDAGAKRSGSDGTRTRDLRRDRPAL